MDVIHLRGGTNIQKWEARGMCVILLHGEILTKIVELGFLKYNNISNLWTLDNLCILENTLDRIL